MYILIAHYTTRAHIMKNTTKTPYEIRLDILQLSFDILQARALATTAETAAPGTAIFATTAPTVEEVIANAKTLNEFVSTGPV